MVGPNPLATLALKLALDISLMHIPMAENKYIVFGFETWFESDVVGRSTIKTSGLTKTYNSTLNEQKSISMDANSNLLLNF